MKTVKRFVSAAALFLFLVSGFHNSAEASTGTAFGYLKFYQNQGNYCPTTRSCGGAKYRESHYHTSQPVGDTKILVRRLSDNAVIGTGATWPSSGQYTIYWNDPSTTGNVEAQMVWQGEHKDGRFRIASSTGGYYTWTWNVTLTAGIQTNVGTRVFGNFIFPDSLANLYDGAEKMWANSLANSGKMYSYFTGTQIRAFDSSCPTSCTYASSNIIIIDSATSAYAPQSRVMHEMGHIASYKASRDQSFRFCSKYDYNGSAGWNYTSEEYGCAQFEEGLASHFADVGLYEDWATQPHSCYSTSACSTNYYNLESSTGLKCSDASRRMPLNTMRYLWDIYDDNVDYSGETLWVQSWKMIDAIDLFANGIENRKKDEPWGLAILIPYIDDPDGRSAYDFYANWYYAGTNSAVQFVNNCGLITD